jgi:ATP/maltotriose-dependent transcriptional regulator MalT
MYADELGLALESCAAAHETALRGGDISILVASATYGCTARLLGGELEEAIAVGEQGLEAIEEYGNTVAPGWATGFLADAYMQHGDLESAERTLRRAGAPEELPDNAHWHWFLDARCRLLILRRELRTALEETLDCGRRFERVGGKNPAFMPWRSRAALCLTELGEEPERARVLAAEEVELARAWGAPRALGAALRAQGLVIGGKHGIELLAEAVEALRDSPARLEFAKAQTELGSALRRANRRREAREPLRHGMELARVCGAVPLVERAHSELRATGARPRKLVFSGVESLTAREWQVAKLAATGRSNPEIAQELFVTPRTIEVKLGSALRKLGASSNRELALALEM